MTVIETYPDGTQLVEFETQVGEKRRFIKHEDGFSISETLGNDDLEMEEIE